MRAQSGKSLAPLCSIKEINQKEKPQMRIGPKNNLPKVPEPKDQVKNVPQFGIASEVKDRFEAAKNQTARASIFDAGPRSVRMETINETRALLDKSMHQRSGFELPPELERIVGQLEGIGSEVDSSQIPAWIKDLASELNRIKNGRTSINQQKLLDELKERLSYAQSNGEPISNQSMEFYLKVRDALEAAMRSRETE
jgi:hypothetical protein